MTLFGGLEESLPDESTMPASDAGPDRAVTWTELGRSTRQRCDRCVELAYQGLLADPIRRAAWRRVELDAGTRHLCHPHAHDARLQERRT